jgi:uncharacterized membrane protein
MDGENWLRVAAVIGAVVHIGFTYKETRGWGPVFVAKAAPAWVDHLPVERLSSQTVASIDWAKRLAMNVGIFNLVLAIGLLWVAVAGASVAGSLGIFLGIWLLIAAAAALATKVYPAFVAQGLLGVAMLVLSIWAA